MYHYFLMLAIFPAVFLFLPAIANFSAKTGSTARMWGGVKADPMEFPFVAAVTIVGRNGERTTCVGALVGAQHVLTAGHCVAGKGYSKSYVHLGLKESTNGKAEFSQKIQVMNVNKHPMFQRELEYFKYDVAVLKLEHEAVLEGPVKLTAISQSEVNNDMAACTVVGFGPKNGENNENQNTWDGVELQMASVTILSYYSCESLTGITFVRDGSTCTNSSTSGLCPGDRGTPLVCLEAGKRKKESKGKGRTRSDRLRLQRVLTAISTVSHSNCKDDKIPGIYTRIGDPDVLGFINTFATSIPGNPLSGVFQILPKGIEMRVRQ